MNYPQIKTGGLFWGMQALLIPDTVLLLYPGPGSDRLRRIRYADIRRVHARIAFPVVAALLSALLIAVGAGCLALDATGVGAAFCALGGLFTLLCLARKKTIVEILTDDTGIRIRKLWLSSRKRDAFLNALLEGIRRNQDAPPLRNGVSIVEAP